MKQGVDHPEMLDHFARLSARHPADGPGPRGGPAARPATRLGGRGLFLLAEIDEFIDDPPGVVAALRGGPASASPRPAAPCSTRPTTASSWRATCSGSAVRRRPRSSSKAARSGSAGSSPEAEDPEAEWLLSRAYLQQDRMRRGLRGPGAFRLLRRRAPPDARAQPLCRARRPASPATAKRAASYDGTRHTRSFYHGTGLLDLPMPDRPRPRPRRSQGPAHRSTARDERDRGPSQIGDRVVADGRGVCVRDARALPDDDRPRRRTGSTAPCGVSHYRHADGSGWGPTVRRRRPFGLAGGPAAASGSTSATASSAASTATSPARATSATPAGRRPGPGGRRPRHRLRAMPRPGGNHLRAIAGDFEDPKGSRFRDRQRRRHPAATANGQCAECHIVGLRLRDRAGARRPRLRPLAGRDLDLQPMLHRERRRHELHDLPRPAPRGRAYRRLLRGEVPGRATPGARERRSRPAADRPRTAGRGPSARSTRPRTASAATCPRSRCPTLHTT